MRFSPSLLALAMLMAPTAILRADITHPAAQAVVGAYSRMLTINPNDADALLGRALEYYKHGENTMAMTDVTRARATIKESDKARYAKAMKLGADIDMRLGNYAQAYTQYESAIKADPSLAAGISSSADFLVARACHNRLAGDNSAAMTDILDAIAAQPDNNAAINELTLLSQADFAGVTQTINSLIDSGNNVATNTDLLGRVMMANYRFADAEAIYQNIIDRNLINSHAMFARLAECQLAQCKLIEAGINIDLGMSKDGGGITDNFILKSRIERARGNRSEAIRFARYAANQSPDNTDARRQLQLCKIDNGDYADVADELNLYVFDHPEAAVESMMVAWIYNDFMRKPEAARNRYISTGFEGTDDESSIMAAIAELYGGNAKDALDKVADILSHPDPTGRINYLAACAYAAAGQTQQAMQCVANAVANGYGNLYDWLINSDMRVNVAPLRSEPGFNRLVTGQ